MFEAIVDQGPAGVLAAMTEQLAKLPAELWRTENDGFAAIAEAIDALAVQVDCARVGLVAEAQSRGVVTASSSSGPADWLMAHSFHLEPSDATRTAELARACTQPANQVLAAAVAGGTLTVRKAVTALRPGQRPARPRSRRRPTRRPGPTLSPPPLHPQPDRSRPLGRQHRWRQPR